VARRIGKDRMQFWLDSLSYGTKKINSRIDSFWLDNSLKITPDEQLGLIKGLYFHQLPFFPVYQAIVKNDLPSEDKPDYKLGYKTGAGVNAEGKNLVWVLGWIEENRHPYFFVLNFDTPDKNSDTRSITMKMLKGILKQLGFLEGKM
jgi:beta-lactamase class D